MLIPFSSLQCNIKPNNALESIKLLKLDTNIKFYSF